MTRISILSEIFIQIV